MAQALSCRSGTAEAWVRSSVKLREVCGVLSGTGIYFSQCVSIFPKAILFRKSGSVGLRSASLEAVAWLNRLIGGISPWEPRSRYRAR
jgi:hypothetical protein